MPQYLVVLEKSEDNFSAYLPDLTGCVVTAETREETLLLMSEAIDLHIRGLREDGLPIPEPSTSAEYLAV